MATSGRHPTVWVEGRDDKHVLIHLLQRHGIEWDAGGDDGAAAWPKIDDAGGATQLLSSISIAVKAAEGGPVGFVVDANTDPEGRWQRIVNELAEVDVECPDTPPARGFLGRSERFDCDVGVWLMPDNSLTGALEHFLHELIEEEDALIVHASDATEKARELGAAFPKKAELKAKLHAWLAWQETPGCPYGIAMAKKYFDANADLAQRFVDWFRELYEDYAASL